jgi:acyl carrier protein
MTASNGHLGELREMIADVLELEPGEIADGADFVETYDADSLRAIEILARIEKKYKVEIPQSELPEMRNVKTVYEIVARYTGWQDLCLEPGGDHRAWPCVEHRDRRRRVLLRAARRPQRYRQDRKLRPGRLPARQRRRGAGLLTRQHLRAP